MLICEFLDWAERAGTGERAEAVGALAKTYLYADLDPIDRGDAERAFAALLDDPSPLVRRALAEALASAADAPRHILLALTSDRPDIAAIVLERSPVLADTDLVETVRNGDDAVQCAVARRARVSEAVARVLVERGSLAATLVLCRNPGAALDAALVRRLVSRFAGEPEMRDALCRRGDLTPDTRHELVVATAAALTDFVVGCAWMTADRARKVAVDAGDRATVLLAATRADAARSAELDRFVSYLHRAGHLTPALVVRAIMSRDVAFLAAALAELSGRDKARVAGLLRNASGFGFAALLESAGLPRSLLPIVRSALRRIGDEAAEPEGRLDRCLIAGLLEASAGTCEAPGQDALRVLLHRFEVEAARDEARRDRAGLAAARLPSPRTDRTPPLLLEAA